MGIEIVSIMAGFAFGYCIVDIIQNYRTKRAQDRDSNFPGETTILGDK